MEIRETAWAKRWQRDTADCEGLVSELGSLRTRAIGEDVPLFEPVAVDKLDQTLRRISDNAGLGRDCVEPGAIKHVRGYARQEFCHILERVIRSGALPWGSVVCHHSLASQRGSGPRWRETNWPSSRSLFESWTGCFTVKSLPGVTLLMVSVIGPLPTAVLGDRPSTAVSR